MLRRLQPPIVLLLALFTATTVHSSGFIDTPDECYMLSGVDKDKVFLTKGAIPCKGKPGRVFVQISGAAKVYLDNSFWKVAVPENMTIPDLQGALDKAEALTKSLKVTENVHYDAMFKEAEKTNEFFRSPAFQKKIAAETERIKSQIYGMKSQMDEYYDTKEINQKKGQCLLPDERVYLFVSSSMPLQTVRTYVTDVASLKEPNIKLVMRGFVGGMHLIGPTTTYIASALAVLPGCYGRDCAMQPTGIDIDPLLFRKYGINKVPAFVYARGVKPVSHDASDGMPGGQMTSYTVIYGDASLSYILEQMRRETGSKSLGEILAKRRGY